MKKIYLYTLRGYDRYDSRTDTYYDTRTIEILLDKPSGNDAIKSAEKLIKCNNYMIIACYERTVEKEFTEQEKKQVLDLLFRMAIKQ